jgi:hypothetical protein
MLDPNRGFFYLNVRYIQVIFLLLNSFYVISFFGKSLCYIFYQFVIVDLIHPILNHIIKCKMNLKIYIFFYEHILHGKNNGLD